MAALLAVLLVVNMKTAADSKSDAVIVKNLRTDKTVEILYKSIVSDQALTFSCVMRSSDRAPEEHEYTGIELSRLLALAKVEANQLQQIVIKGSDGYCVALTADEALQEENAYVVFKQDGKAIADKKHGGSGPLLLVIRDDPYAQRWCKYVTEVDVK